MWHTELLALAYREFIYLTLHELKQDPAAARDDGELTLCNFHDVNIFRRSSSAGGLPPTKGLYIEQKQDCFDDILMSLLKHNLHLRIPILPLPNLSTTFSKNLHGSLKTIPPKCNN